MTCTLSRWLAATVLAAGLGGPASAGVPSCDQLRKCATELADVMVASGGWPPATIAQYRRLGSSPLDSLPNAASVCAANLRVIGKNAAEYQSRGRLKRLPGACR